MKIRKSNEYPILYWMITFLIICVSQDTLLFGTNGNSIYTTIAKVIPFVVIGLIVVSRNVFLWNKKKFTMVSVICMLPVISCVANGENINNYVYRFAIMLAGAFVVMFMEMRMFYELFRRIIDFLSIWSIGTFMLSYLVPGLVKMMPIIRNSRGFGYYNMIFSVVSFDGSLRNHSIFREPGMFMVMLVIATFIEILIAEKINMKRIFLYSIAILTTISTAGYIILALVYIYIILMDDRIKSRYKMLLILFIVFAAVILIQCTDLFAMGSEMFSKFNKGSNSYGSWFARISSVTGNLDIALKNPLFGIGRYTLYGTVLASEGVYVVLDNTNTLMINFAAFGLLYGSICIYGLFKFINKYKKKLVVSVFIFVLLFLAFSNEDIGQNIIFYVLVFDGLLLSSRKLYSK